MKSIALKGDLRADLGKSANKKLRSSGMVPCVLYGGNDHVHFSAYEADFKNLVYTPNSYLVRLDVQGKMHVAILQDVQYHPVSEQILHADFLEVEKDKPITIKVPVRLIGDSPGLREGGNLHLKISKLLVRGMSENLPDFIEVDINDLTLGKNICVRDISFKGGDLLDTPENSIISCKITRASLSEEEEELEGVEEGEEGAEGAEGEEGAEGADRDASKEK